MSEDLSGVVALTEDMIMEVVRKRLQLHITLMGDAVTISLLDRGSKPQATWFSPISFRVSHPPATAPLITVQNSG